MQQKFELDLNFFEFQFYRKWSIKRRGAYFIFPVRRERRLFQLRLENRVRRVLGMPAQFRIKYTQRERAIIAGSTTPRTCSP